MPHPTPVTTLKIQRLTANTEGRDFVCGDIHGAYTCVTQFLEKIGFDKVKDRLICAGDLVDRGPYNVEALRLIYEPWFYCCKGNHEQLMEEYFKGGVYGQWWAPNGGGWGLKYTTEKSSEGDFVRKAVKDVGELPYLITVEKRDGKIFHVLHAELPPYGPITPITDELLADPEKFTKVATVQTQDGDNITWGRYVFYSLYKRQLDETSLRKYKKEADIQKLGNVFNPALSHIYSGHTIMVRPVTFKGQTNLDTMAYGSYARPTAYSPGFPELWCGLTVTEPETGKFWLVNDREFKEVEPVVI